MSDVKPVRTRYVPMITESQLIRLEALVAKLQSVGEECDEQWRQLEASLTVLTGENEPEGLAKVHVRRDRVRRKAKKSL